MSAVASHPTAVRFFVIGVASLSSVLLYLDRFCITFAERFIKEDLLLSDWQISWFLSSFFWSYAFAQIPSGWLSDRFGARRMMTFYILAWSVFTAFTGLVHGFLLLILVRLGFGLGQAGAYPTCAGLVSKWIPFSQRAAASGFIAFGGRMGGALAPILTVFVMLLFVPTSSPSLLTAEDLLDVQRLGSELAPASDVHEVDFASDSKVIPLHARTHAQLSGSIQTVVARWSRQQVDLQAKTDAGVDGPSAGELRAATQTADAQRLVEEINDQLRSRDFLRPEDFPPGTSSLPRELKRLRERPRSDLSQEEVERLNRLAIEVAFPESIRKIYVQGWRPTMIVFGLVGLVIAALFWWIIRDRPAIHPHVSDEETQLIESGRPQSASNPHGRVVSVPIVPILKSRNVWLMSLSQFGVNIGWVFLLTWMPRYLVEVHDVPAVDRAFLLFLPPAIGWIGMLGGGFLSDALVARFGLRWGRRLPWLVSRFVAAIAYTVCIFEPNLVTVMVAFCIVALCTDIGTSSGWACNQDIGGPHVGSVLGFGNMCGNLGAAISPPLLTTIVEYSSWNWAFGACAASFLVASIASLGVDASRPIQTDDVKQQAQSDS